MNYLNLSTGLEEFLAFSYDQGPPYGEGYVYLIQDPEDPEDPSMEMEMDLVMNIEISGEMEWEMAMGMGKHNS
jgi:hypothetical protein